MRGPPFQIAPACRRRLSGLNRVVGGEAQISMKVMPLGRSYEACAPKFGRGRGPRVAEPLAERLRASVELCVAPWPGLSLEIVGNPGLKGDRDRRHRFTALQGEVAVADQTAHLAVADSR